MSEINKIKNYHSKLDTNLLSRERVRSSEDDHYMEFVDEIFGVAYINDSKSINLKATRNSIDAIETSVVLIIGGHDTGTDYSLLKQQVKQKVVAIIYLGEEEVKILEHFESHYMLFAKADSLKESVEIASAYARSGDVVLFSPGCAANDNGDTYKKRGNEFKELVKKLMV